MSALSLSLVVMCNVSFIIVIIVVVIVVSRAWSSYNNQPSYRQNYGSDYRLYFMASGLWSQYNPYHHMVATSD